MSIVAAKVAKLVRPGKDAAAAAPAMIARPPKAATASDAAASDAFFLAGRLVDAWFIRRSDVLLVTFDNLASVGEYDPPQPWLQARAAKGGFSILGLIASRKDWYRNDDTPQMISALRDAGLFAQFRRVVFVGASMGGFAALTYSALVPGAVVLAFSPQTTLSKKIARFERRFQYAVKKWDWESPAFLDAANAAPHAAEVHLVYDPFVPEDRAHARRITGANVREIRLDHLGHKAIRHLKSLELLQDLIADVAEGRFDPEPFWRGFRARRKQQFWQRNLLVEAARRGHGALTLRAAEHIHAVWPDRQFALSTIAELQPLPKALPVNAAAVSKDAAPPPAGQILMLRGALILPERDHDTPLGSGVLQADGSWCELSKAWIRQRKSTPAPTLHPHEDLTDLPGAHLFAGHFRRHFGHFLVESTARLWALDYIKEPLASIIYLPYRGTVAPIERAIEAQAPFFRLLGINTLVKTYGGVLRVERLYVPELGFGWSELYAGTPAYRAFMQGRLNAAVAAEGSDRLYISRARLNAQRGGILGEVVLEENLARQGYEIFHPEKHPLEVQIARYKAARQIVALDGSALHLTAYVLRPASQVAMILRRSRANTADYDRQFRAFCGVAPDVIDVVRRDWVAEGNTRVDFRSIGELDFKALFETLAALGYVAQDFRPDLPSEADTRFMLAAYEAKRGAPFRTLFPGERFPDEDEI